MQQTEFPFVQLEWIPPVTSPHSAVVEMMCKRFKFKCLLSDRLYEHACGYSILILLPESQREFVQSELEGLLAHFGRKVFQHSVHLSTHGVSIRFISDPSDESIEGGSYEAVIYPRNYPISRNPYLKGMVV